MITGDVATFDFPQKEFFDRVVSIELFEHMKNYELLMAKISPMLKPGGKLFVHIFANSTTPYDFEAGWMSTHFFTGGTMPSADLLHFFQQHLTLKQQWWVNGRHYAHTSEVRLFSGQSGSILRFSLISQDWLTKMNDQKKALWPSLEETYGKSDAAMWFYRWQIFYMACAELFAFNGGDVWGVSHYLFEKQQ